MKNINLKRSVHFFRGKIFRFVFYGAFSMVITGCANISHVPIREDIKSSSPQTRPVETPVNGKGGYYKDDGPEINPPNGLMETPDAEPKIEPYAKGPSKPYVAFGKTYIPIIANQPFRQQGIGSWYGKKFHGQKTASGERYDMYKMTAAHPTLPIPSYARITNLSNGKRIIVRINDRGPFHSSRVIDLSYTAALKLGYLTQGSGLLEVERLLPDDIVAMNKNKSHLEDTNHIVIQAMTSNSIPEELTPPQINLTSGYYLQLGAYAQAARAQEARVMLEKKWALNLPAPVIVQSDTLYRIYSGPFASKEEANKNATQLRTTGMPALVVQR